MWSGMFWEIVGILWYKQTKNNIWVGDVNSSDSEGIMHLSFETVLTLGYDNGGMTNKHLLKCVCDGLEIDLIVPISMHDSRMTSQQSLQPSWFYFTRF